MQKDRAFIELFKSLRIAINNASVYSFDHPLFIRSVDNAKSSLNNVFIFTDPLVIKITPDKLILDDQDWENDKISRQLASAWHRRKIKTMELCANVTREELISLFKFLAGSAKDAGAGDAVRYVNTPHVRLTELDYSELLGAGMGDVPEDLWSHLFDDALGAPGNAAVDKIVSNFDNIVSGFFSAGGREGGKLQDNFRKFMHQLKEADNARFYDCAKKIAKQIFNAKSKVGVGALEGLKQIISSVNVSDLSNILWEKACGGDSLDTITFHLFSRLIDQDRHREIASNLARRMNSEPAGGAAALKIRELLFSSRDEKISNIYRKTLASFLKDTLGGGSVRLKPATIRYSYRYTLLNLLILEIRPEWLGIVAGQVIAEWSVFSEEDRDYVNALSDVIDKKIVLDPNLADVLEALRKHLSGFMEGKILQGDGFFPLSPVISALDGSIAGIDAYINTIFYDNNVSDGALRLYFHFFSNDLAIFEAELKRKKDDMDFLHRIVGLLGDIDSLLSLRVLRYIFSFANILMRIEVLKGMKKLSKYSLYDQELLFSLIRDADVNLRREALAVLAEDAGLLRRALEIMLFPYNPFGFRNNVIINNINIIKDINLKAAQDCLKRIISRRSIWSRGVSRAARGVLSVLSS